MGAEPFGCSVDDPCRQLGREARVEGRELVGRRDRCPVVRVDEQRPDAGVELLADRAVVLGPYLHDVGTRHGVVGRGLDDLVVVAVAQLDVAVAGVVVRGRRGQDPHDGGGDERDPRGDRDRGGRAQAAYDRRGDGAEAEDGPGDDRDEREADDRVTERAGHP